MRSILTMLGVVFGVCAVIVMLAITEGLSWEAQEQIRRLGATNILVNAVKPPQDLTGTGTRQFVLQYGLTYADAERIKSTVPGVKVIAPARNIQKTVRYRSQATETRVYGTVPWYIDLYRLNVRRGRFLSTVDMHSRASRCVLGYALAQRLMRHEDPIGKDIKVGSDYFTVIGVLGPRGAMGPGAAGKGADELVYIPLTTAQSRYGDLLIDRRAGSRSAESVEIHHLTIQADDTDAVPGVARVVKSLLEKFHKKKDWEIIVPLELLRQKERTKKIFQWALGSVAAMSLLVGGIGIMNIMLASVTERTREIGIRRALGAKQRDITSQFLVETLVLTSLGGLIGIAVGLGGVVVVEWLSGMRTIVTFGAVSVAFGISALVGYVSGLYPARRAALLDPIQALRHE